MFARFGHYIVIVLITFLFYYPYLMPGIGLLAGGDFYAFFAPYRVFASEQLNSGIFPFRTNQLFGGYPIFQDPQFALLYPINFLYGLLVPDANSQAALDIYMLVNSLLLSIAALFFARSFHLGRLPATVAAVFTSFNGFVVIHYTHVNMLQVYTTSLAAAAFLVRFTYAGRSGVRYIIAAGAMFGMGNLAGHPQSTMYMHYGVAVGVALLAVNNWHKSRAWQPAVKVGVAGIAAMALGLLLAAVQLLPTASLLGVSTRASVSRAEVLWSALSLQQLPVFLFPAFYEKVPWFQLMARDPAITPDVYRIVHYWVDPYEGMVAVGLFALVLGCIGWFAHGRSWLVQMLGWGSVLIIACALGNDLPFYGWIYEVLPGFSLVRVSTRILMVFFPAWGLLVGLGAQALWNQNQKAVAVGRYAVLLLLTLLLGWVCWILVSPREAWFKIWTAAVFTNDSGSLSQAVREAREAGHFQYLELQLAAAVALTLMALGTFWLPRLWPRSRLIVVLVMGSAELGMYGIAYVRPDHFPNLTSVKAESLQSIPNSVSGRALAPGFLEGGGVINSALFMEGPLANGYSVTIDDWVTAFLPDTMPPWRLGMQRLLFDLWNVSDVVVNSRPINVTIDSKAVTLDDWGWSEVGMAPPAGMDDVTARNLIPRSISINLETSQPVQALHVVGFAGKAAELQDDTLLAQVTVSTTTGYSHVADLRLGEHLADGRYYDASHNAAHPAHSIASQVYQRYLPIHPSHGMRLYQGKLDLSTTAPVEMVKVEAMAPYPSTVGISHVIAILDDGSEVVGEPIEMEGFTETTSNSTQFRTLHRSTAPGFIRVVPRAVPGSYQKKENIMWRLFNRQQDPLQTVIIDKRLIDDATLKAANSPRPDDLQATATISWHASDRLAEVQVKSNQPAWLSLSYVYDAGWSAEANGKPLAIYRANGPFMAIPIAAGYTTIKMTYVPVNFTLGVAISVVTALIMLLCFALNRPLV